MEDKDASHDWSVWNQRLVWCRSVRRKWLERNLRSERLERSICLVGDIREKRLVWTFA